MPGAVCEQVQLALVQGEALDAALRGHVETCDDCRFLAGLPGSLDASSIKPAQDRTGEVVDGKYRLVRQLGTGGMGAVYAAEHTGIGKQVAIKFLHRELTTDPEVVARFAQEARAAAAVGSRSIIDVYDIGNAADGSPFIVMELLLGESMRSTIRRHGQLSIEYAISILIPLLGALAAAHRKGIVHRDLKPDNVFLETTAPAAPPLVKLLDFGIAKMSERGVAPTTRTGTTMGTPHYMPPEQARGERGLDHRVDLYAAGVILYEALTGACPYEGDNYNALLVRILTAPPVAPRSLRPGLPAGLEAVILRAIEKDRDARYQSADDMAAALDPYAKAGDRLPAETPPPGSSPFAPSSAASIPATESPVTPATGAPQGRRQARWPLLLGLAVLAAGGVALWVSSVATHGSRGEASRLAPVAAEDRAPSPVTAPQPRPDSAPATTPRPISIALEGVPPGARVFFDEAEVPELPIRVMPRVVMVRLRVEADGHAPFARMVVPDRDQVVQITMVPARVGAPARGGFANRPASRITPAGESVPEQARSPAAREERSGGPFLTDTSEFGGPR